MMKKFTAVAALMVCFLVSAPSFADSANCQKVADFWYHMLERKGSRANPAPAVVKESTEDHQVIYTVILKTQLFSQKWKIVEEQDATDPLKFKTLKIIRSQPDDSFQYIQTLNFDQSCNLTSVDFNVDDFISINGPFCQAVQNEQREGIRNSPHEWDLSYKTLKKLAKENGIDKKIRVRKKMRLTYLDDIYYHCDMYLPFFPKASTNSDVKKEVDGTNEN